MLCNYLQNVAAITYIFVLQLSTFLFYNKHAEKLGYEVSYLWVASSSEIATQKFNAAVASGTIPDVVCVNKQDLKQLVDGDLVVDMAPYFEEYASDYLKSLIEAAGEACINACTYNGVQYGIPYVDKLLIFRELICSMIPEN